MATYKTIHDLTALGAAPAADDELEVWDTSASTSKRIPISQLAVTVSGEAGTDAEIAAAVAAEAVIRAAADTALDGRLDVIEAISIATDAELAAAVDLRLAKSANLSDLASASTARTNLGLGTIATQAASAVAITGGSIAGISDLAVADGGTGASTARVARTNLGVASIHTQQAGNTTVIIGDSIAAGGWWEVACAKSSGRMVRMINSGVSGNSSTQMLARIATDVIAYSPRWCVIEGVTPNDQGQSISLATSKANIIAMVAACTDAGVRPIVCMGPPNNTTATRQHMATMNAWLAAWAPANGVPVFDLYSPVVDHSTGQYQSAMNGDGTHPNTDGYRAIGTAVALTLPADFGAYLGIGTTNTDADNLIANPLMITDATSNGAADSWAVYGGGLVANTLTAVGAGYGFGNWQNVQSNGSLTVLEQTFSGWSVGDVLQVSFRLKSTGTIKTYARLSATGGSGFSNELIASAGPIATLAITEVEGVIITQQTIPVPSGTTVIKLQVLADTAAGTFGVAQATIRNLTVLGAV